MGSHINWKSIPNSRKADEECRLSDIQSRVSNKLYIKDIHEAFGGKLLEAE
jgi:hypothetical protein